MREAYSTFTMTICIAALADNEKSVVLASDKMVSQQMPLIEYEHTVEKIVKMNDHFYVLIAGTVNHAVAILDRARPEIKENSGHNAKFEVMKNAYIEYREQQIVDGVLRPQGIRSMDDFQNRHRVLLPDISASVQHLVMHFNLKVVLTLVALDQHQQKCHIRVLGHPGQNLFPLEYASTGTGDMHAVQSLIGAHYQKEKELETATYLVYEAKRRAEVAPGVGLLTDMIVLSLGDTITERRLGVDDIAKLAKVYDTINRRDESDILSLLRGEQFTL